MNKKMKTASKIRTLAFLICFSSGGILILAHFGHLGLGRVPGTIFWDTLVSISRTSGIVAVITTFILLINNAGDGLNTLQKSKKTKQERKRY